MASKKRVETGKAWRIVAASVAADLPEGFEESFAVVRRGVRRVLSAIASVRTSCSSEVIEPTVYQRSPETACERRINEVELVCARLFYFSQELMLAVQRATGRSALIDHRVVKQAFYMQSFLESFTLRYYKAQVRSAILESAEAEIRFRLSAIQSGWERSQDQRLFVSKFGQPDQDEPLLDYCRRYARFIATRRMARRRREDDRNDDI